MCEKDGGRQRWEDLGSGKAGDVSWSLTHKFSRPAFAKFGEFADIRVGEICLKSEAAVENVALLTNQEVFILLWALGSPLASPVPTQ